jgi:hypothetical protein
MFYDTRNQLFIFFFGILFVEDAVRFVSEADTAEEVGRVEAIFAVQKILTVKWRISK